MRSFETYGNPKTFGDLAPGRLFVIGTSYSLGQTEPIYVKLDADNQLLRSGYAVALTHGKKSAVHFDVVTTIVWQVGAPSAEEVSFDAESGRE